MPRLNRGTFILNDMVGYWMQALIDDYLFTEREPLRDDIVNVLQEKPKILERKTIVERVIAKMKAFVETFIEGLGGWVR